MPNTAMRERELSMMSPEFTPTYTDETMRRRLRRSVRLGYARLVVCGDPAGSGSAAISIQTQGG